MTFWNVETAAAVNGNYKLSIHETYMSPVYIYELIEVHSS